MIRKARMIVDKEYKIDEVDKIVWLIYRAFGRLFIRNIPAGSSYGR